MWCNISGTGDEGWFEPLSLLNAFKNKAISLGVEYITGEVVDFLTDLNAQINGVKVGLVRNILTYCRLIQGHMPCAKIYKGK